MMAANSSTSSKRKTYEFPEFKGRMAPLMELCRARIRRTLQEEVIKQRPSLNNGVHVMHSIVRLFIGNRRYVVSRQKASKLKYGVLEILCKNGIIHGVSVCYRRYKTTFTFLLDDGNEEMLYAFYNKRCPQKGRSPGGNKSQSAIVAVGAGSAPNTTESFYNSAIAVQHANLMEDEYALFPPRDNGEETCKGMVDPSLTDMYTCHRFDHGVDQLGQRVFSSFVLNCYLVEVVECEPIIPTDCLRTAMEQKINSLLIPPTLKDYLNYFRRADSSRYEERLERKAMPPAQCYVLKAASSVAVTIFCLQVNPRAVRINKCFTVRI